MKRGIAGATKLPPEGFQGEVPEFPVPKLTILKKVTEEDGTIRYEFDADGTRDFRKRELAVWEQHWRFPQAVAWQREPWCWLELAHFCRTVAQVERDPAPSASLQGRLAAYRLSLGLSAEGLKARGWAIATDEVEEKRAEKAAPARKSARDRLTVVDGSGR
jgi:hypothetical protein